MSHKVIIQKVDLDTALTALLLEVSSQDEIVVVHEQADAEELADPGVICIECGGSGQIGLNNFDHHDTDRELPSACVQAFQAHCEPREQQGLERLVEYVSLLDTRGPEGLLQQSDLPPDSFPTLSGLFSGMLLVTADRGEQLLRGIGLLQALLARGDDPFGLMPELPQWQDYLEAKRRNQEAIGRAIEGAKLFETAGGRKVGFVETEVIGALGALYALGCQIAIAYAPRFGQPPVPKYTIAGNGLRVDSLRSRLNELEAGWGGPAHGTILGSPRRGSKLTPEQVMAIVSQGL